MKSKEIAHLFITCFQASNTENYPILVTGNNKSSLTDNTTNIYTNMLIYVQTEYIYLPSGRYPGWKVMLLWTSVQFPGSELLKLSLCMFSIFGLCEGQHERTDLRQQSQWTHTLAGGKYWMDSPELHINIYIHQLDTPWSFFSFVLNSSHDSRNHI